MGRCLPFEMGLCLGDEISASGRRVGACSLLLCMTETDRLSHQLFQTPLATCLAWRPVLPGGPFRIGSLRIECWRSAAEILAVVSDRPATATAFWQSTVGGLRFSLWSSGPRLTLWAGFGLSGSGLLDSGLLDSGLVGSGLVGSASLCCVMEAAVGWARKKPDASFSAAAEWNSDRTPQRSERCGA